MFRAFPFSMRLAEDIDPFVEQIPVLDRATLGVAPGAEIVHVIARDWQGSRKRLTLLRGQEGTTATDWPAGTSLTWLVGRADYVGPPNVQTLSKPLPAAATILNLAHTYRRLKVGAEILWQVGDDYGSDLRHAARVDVQRAKEGTTAADHDLAAVVTYLAAGES